MTFDLSEDERRELERISSVNLVSYKILNDKRGVIWEGMARTLDLNRKGVKLEVSHRPSKLGKIYIELGLAEDIIRAKGKIVYILFSTEGLYHLGIKFTKLEGKDAGKLIDKFLAK